PTIYFQMYSKSVANVQAGSVHEVTCFTKGAKVLSLRGKLDVSEIIKGDKILSHMGFQEVYDVKVRAAPSTRKIILSDGTELRCTDEHPFLTQRGWVIAKHLTKQDVCFKQV